MTSNDTENITLCLDGQGDSSDNTSFSLICKDLCSDFEDSLKLQAGHLNVYLRIKPQQDKENKSYLEVESDSSVVVHPVQEIPPVINSIRTRSQNTFQSYLQKNMQPQAPLRYTFTKVFKEGTTQEKFFRESALDTISDFLHGQNALLFVYGVTNSGKTYTMQGTSSQMGVIPRAFDTIFNSLDGHVYPRMNFKPSRFSNVVSLNPVEEKNEEAVKEAILSQFSSRNSSLASFNFSRDPSSTALTEDDFDTDMRVRDSSKVPLSSSPNVCYSVWVSFVEIYNEQVYDLLVSPNLGETRISRMLSREERKNLKMKGGGAKDMRLPRKQVTANERTSLPLKEDVHGKTYITGLREVKVDSADEALQLLALGRKNLRIAYTKLNETSSRSHCIFTLKLMTLLDCDSSIRHTKFNVLSMCDLAGIERCQKTSSIGERIKESGNINNSMLTLSRCLQAIKNNQNNPSRERQILPPYRDSKLTRIFRNFLASKGKAKMLIMVSQDKQMYPENLNAIKFSALAKKIVIVAAPAPEMQAPDKQVEKGLKPRRQVHDPVRRGTVNWATDEQLEKWNEKNKSSIDEEEEEEEDEGEATLNGDIDLEGMNEQFLKMCKYAKELEGRLKEEKRRNKEDRNRLVNQHWEEMRKQEEFYKEMVQNQMELFENAEEEKIKNINRAHKAALLNSVSSNQEVEELKEELRDMEGEMEKKNAELMQYKQNCDLFASQQRQLLEQQSEERFKATMETMELKSKLKEAYAEIEKLKSMTQEPKSTNNASSSHHNSPINHTTSSPHTSLSYQTSLYNQTSSTNQTSPSNTSLTDHTSKFNHISPTNHTPKSNHISPTNHTSKSNNISSTKQPLPSNFTSPNATLPLVDKTNDLAKEDLFIKPQLRSTRRQKSQDENKDRRSVSEESSKKRKRRPLLSHKESTFTAQTEEKLKARTSNPLRSCYYF